MIGKTIGHYEILQEIGAGGMGVVYRARDVRLDRPVAFKVLPEDLTRDAHRRARFLQEARSASAVNHPAIAQIYDADEIDGIAFIAMELVEGRTVRQLIAARELDLLGAVEIGVQVAEGLSKAHDAKIVHRDIKSDNVMVTPDGHAKILDFGLAKPFGEAAADGDDADPEATIRNTLTTMPGMVVGTLAYMSPEQARSRPVDQRSDLFSLGVVLYEMVAGELPFHGESPLDTLHAIAFEETRPVTALRANVPASLQRSINRCLRKQPQDRYESAEELARDLRAVGKEIDSGISTAVPLGERFRESLESLRGAGPTAWLLPAGALAAAVMVIVLISGSGEGKIPLTFFFAFVGLMVYRRIRNRRPRLLKRFAKKASKMSEVRVVSWHETQVTVVVEKPLAKTYVHLNSLMDGLNGKLFFGDRFTLSVRENVPADEVRALLQSSGVVYVSDDLVLAERN
ncbi:MAG TPA: serine/threonine-protein kinase [bacterium]|nr:serine/threonine-protein kinase [bacterium]